MSVRLRPLQKLAKPAKEPAAPPLPSALPVEVEESLKQALGSEVRVAYHTARASSPSISIQTTS